MASIASGLLSGGIEGAGKGIAAVVNAIKGRNPEDAAKLQELLTKHDDLVTQTLADIEKAKIQANVDLNETAGANIRAEAQANWYTASARPSVIYCWILIMLWNYVIAQWFHKMPVTLPDLFWEVSGVVITGYVFARGVQEVSSKVVGGAGGTLQLPFGIKAESKGD